jgi:hypothetical protein
MDRSAHTRSCSRKFTVFHPHPPAKATALRHTLLPEEMPIRTVRPRTNVSSASLLLETSYFSPVDTWLSAEIAQLEWSNSAQAVKSPDEKKQPPQKQKLPSPFQDPRPLLDLLFPTPPLQEVRRLVVENVERERQKDGIVPFVDNLILHFYDSLFLQTASLSMRISMLNSHVLLPERAYGRQTRDMHLVSPRLCPGEPRRCWRV